MHTAHERVVRALSGALGLVGGVTSGLALAIVAVVGPLLGLLSVLTAPIRAVLAWLRGRRV
jgi:uncharacterized membrane protein